MWHAAIVYTILKNFASPNNILLSTSQSNIYALRLEMKNSPLSIVHSYMDLIVM